MLHNSQVNILNVVVLYPALNIQIGITEISKIKTHLAWNVVTLLSGGLRATDTSLTILSKARARHEAVQRSFNNLSFFIEGPSNPASLGYK